MTARRPPAIYRKPRGVDLTDADGMRELAKRMREPDKLGRLLDQLAATLRAYLAENGARLLERIPDERQRGCTCAAIDRGVAIYRTGDVPPGVPEAVDALYQIREMRQANGDAKALAAVYLGAALERARASEAFAGPLDSYSRGRAKPVTSDAAIAKRIAERKPGERWADIAAALRMSERQLRTRRERLEAKNRKSVRPPPR